MKSKTIEKNILKKREWLDSNSTILKDCKCLILLKVHQQLVIHFLNKIYYLEKKKEPL